MSGDYYAHSKEEKPSKEWHSLQEHLMETAKKAEFFADSFGNGDWAHLAGLWHDLGKYSQDFQKRLFRKDGTDTHIRVDHSTAGALHAIERLGEGAGRILSYMIAGHHTGLPDWSTAEEGRASLQSRLAFGDEHLAAIKNASISAHIIEAENPLTRIPALETLSLWIRMIYSCLVDADFLDTESFMDRGKSAMRGGYRSLLELKTLFDGHLQDIGKKTGRINDLRNSVLKQCMEKAEAEPTLFTLTVPTGGGGNTFLHGVCNATRGKVWQGSDNLRHSLYRHHRTDGGYFQKYFR